MFEADYEDVVTIMKPKVGTMGVAGVPTEFEPLLDANENPVELECAMSERSRRIIDAQGDQIDTDGTLLFRGDDPAGLAKGDVIVTDDDRAFEVVGLERMPLRGSTGSYARADLKLRADLPAGGDE